LAEEGGHRDSEAFSTFSAAFLGLGCDELQLAQSVDEDGVQLAQSVKEDPGRAGQLAAWPRGCG
jgi:hypothetical protein